jgi:hypothetical protein
MLCDDQRGWRRCPPAGLQWEANQAMRSWLGRQTRFGGRLSVALASFGLLVGPGINATAMLTSDVLTTDVSRGDGVIEVPSEVMTVQEAVDAARPGDLILIAAGIYNEAVDVTTGDVTIRGVDRDEVVFDGEFELANGIRVLGASGVAIENLTVRNYASNGIFWTGVDGFRGSYLTSIRNQEYGIYAYDSQHGQIDHSYAAGSGDGGFYVGQCFPCDTVVDTVLSEHNGLGFSDANAGGNLLIVNSTFRSNRVGIALGSHTNELCYPQRQATVIGNLIYSNNEADTGAEGPARLAMGNGILVAGGIANRIERNRIWDHDRTGVAIVPNPEQAPNDDMPDRDDWTLTCAESRDLPIAETLPALNLWEPYDNRVIGNVLSDNRDVDVAVASPTADLPNFGNCASSNDYTVTAPAALEMLAPCDGEPGDGDWRDGEYDIVAWLVELDSMPPAVPYTDVVLPSLPDLDEMPDAATAPAAPARDLPRPIDVEAIEVPSPPS